MYKDMETGLYYNVRRYYDWRVGRYLQPDPVSDLNLYVYGSNSPYDAVDPVEMFEVGVKWSPYFVPLLHVGVDPNHEEITESAISELYGAYPGKYSKLYQYGFRLDDWRGVYFRIGTLTFQCRTGTDVRPDADRVAQGTNIADCLFLNDSSYHCDNSNFDGCDEKGFMVMNPVSNGLVTCQCSGGGGSGGGGGRGRGGGEGGGAGCSVAKQRLKNKGYDRCQYFFPSRPEECKCVCSFKVAISPDIRDLGQMDYEKLGRLLHPIQDFWSHSTAIYVPGCKTKKCVKKVLGVCLDEECAEYYRNYNWTNLDIPMRTQAGNVGLRTGWFGANGWSALEDVACLWPPCNAHCMLNKDDGSFSRDDFSPCDGNIQKDAHWEVKSKATDSTKYHLDLFCKGLGGICY
jgi:hypothetical protein